MSHCVDCVVIFEPLVNFPLRISRLLPLRSAAGSSGAWRSGRRRLVEQAGGGRRLRPVRLLATVRAATSEHPHAVPAPKPRDARRHDVPAGQQGADTRKILPQTR